MSADVTDLADYRRVVVSLTRDGRAARLQILAFARQGMLADIADRLGLSGGRDQSKRTSNRNP